ncbi:lamin tail domain-containing protein [Akkermansiaceae bacterium]|nr:lamin tail domain-containing protein [Akkermansiaceae bacterium]
MKTALFFLLLFPSIAVGQLSITEFVADNDGSYLDSDGDASDWIELHNSGATEASTEGLFLTDRDSDLVKWSLPDVTIPAGGYLVVFASGKDRRDPQGELHSNFSLSAGGEFLALVASDGVTPLSQFTPEYPRQFFGVAYGTGTNAATESETLVPWPAAATWTVPPSDIGDSWQLSGFDDAAWNSAQTGIGYGYSFPDFIGAGGDTGLAMRGIAGSAYLRIPFDVDNPVEVVGMNLELFYEDGFAAYLNGELVVSKNLPEPLRYDSIATDRGEIREGDTMESFPLDFAGKLRSGENILAFQILNDSAGSSDILLIPMLTAATRDLSGGVIGGYLEEPTPGAPNSGIEFTDYVRDTTFDVDRGFFEAPFGVNIESATPGATIIYTTDGSTPTLSNGTRVAPTNDASPASALVDVTTSTALRAIAVKTGLRPSNVDTQTYLFLDDVLNQPAQPPGYPLPWRSRNGNTIPGDFQMDPDVVGSVYTREELKESLRDLPTISIVTDIGNLFDQQTGIQVNPQDSGPNSERRVSVEMIDFEDGSPIQLDAGMLMNGNASRNPNRGKHNFRLAFRNEYGAGKLRFPLFGSDAPTETFNQIILRGGNGNSWVHPTAAVRQFAMYIRDQWFRDARFAMGYPEALQNEVHVYINGLYFGMHHLFERIEEEWTAERFGGDEDDWEGFRIVGGNNIEVIKGTQSEVNSRMLESWRTVLDAARAGDLETVEQYLDLDSFIDYLVLNFHAGNTDWDQNNVRAMRRVNPPGKYMFFCHDAERAGLNGLSTGNLNINSITHGRGGTQHRPTSINAWLQSNPEYAQRFADRAYKHMFNDGALTPENGAAQWDARAQGIRLAMKAESARWGDHVDSTPRTLVDFDRGLNREYNTWFPNRTPISISQFRAAGLYPDIDPPVFSQHGGMIASGSGLILTNDTGDIYYTTDGSDPRLSGGGIHPNAIKINGAKSEQTLIAAGATGWSYLDDGSDQGSAWKEPAYNDSLWAVGDAPLGFGSVNDHPFSGPWINPDRNITVYFRKDFEVTNSSLITEATARVMSDGGAIVYLNGTEIARDNMPADPVDFETEALSDSNIREGNIDVFTFPPSAFVEGTNVIAIELHNGSAGSSDMGMDLQLDVTALNTPGDAITIDGPTTVRTRSFDGNEWSALSEAVFVTAPPASAENLVISEIYYHPSGDPEVTEYLELMNISGETISLAGAVFNGGITFAFPDDAVLGAGERLILVADLDGFEAAFGNGLPVAGTYAGRLDNGGETISLLATEGAVIQNFQYDDRAPWPLPADGDGFSLSLIAPAGNPDPGEAANWRSSLVAGGSPGVSDGLPFQGTTADGLLAYALVDALEPFTISIRNFEDNGSFGEYLVATVSTMPGADDARVVVEFSSDLENWESGTAVFLGSDEQAGVTRREWRAPTPWSVNNPLRFARLVVTARP